MVTADEIAAIPLFEALPRAELERLSNVSADIHLLPAEWAVNEGDERALFAVLDGHLEVVKLFDGVPRVIGNRHTGDIFGEVPELKRAKLGSGVDYVLADVFDWDPPCSTSALRLLAPRPERALRALLAALGRVLKPDGRAFLVDNAARSAIPATWSSHLAKPRAGASPTAVSSTSSSVTGRRRSSNASWRGRLTGQRRRESQMGTSSSLPANAAGPRACQAAPGTHGPAQPAAAETAPPAPRSLRSNSPQARSRRRKPIVPLTRAQARIGR
jgi:hypothetical protein